VPGDDPNNNAHAAIEAFLSRVPIPKDQIHPIPTDQPPEKAAEHYETLLRKVFGNATPRFDLILLGLGEDGHTASLFPGTSILNEQERWVKEVFLEAQNSYRISLTVPAIIEADQIVFLVKGANKALALKEVLEGPFRPQEFPAQMIKPKHGELIWLIDQEAAKQLHTKM
jgi:6-phosphogluconolactonase